MRLLCILLGHKWVPVFWDDSIGMVFDFRPPPDDDASVCACYRCKKLK